jgi:SAM-dependent methyltransferase
MADLSIGRVVFDEIAELYDEARQRYPEELIDDIVSLAGTTQGGRILEVGCGTGQATLAFARRGYSILGLEPGARPAEVARRNLNAYPRADIQVTTFEDWELDEGAYELVVFADSFRWIAPSVGYSKSAQALKPGGSLAIFRNTSAPEDSELRREMDAVYRQHAPELAGYDAQRASAGAGERRQADMSRLGLFEPVTVRRYPWVAEFDAIAYTKLLNTYSDHRRLKEGTRRSLCDAIAALIDRHGGVYRKSYVAMLHLARKKPD